MAKTKTIKLRFDVEIMVTRTPGCKGDGPMAYAGPTPDTPEELEAWVSDGGGLPQAMIDAMDMWLCDCDVTELVGNDEDCREPSDGASILKAWS